jgi:hypothetical protein
VSMTEVVEMRVGSEISCFWIDFLRIPVRLALRKPATEPIGTPAPEGKAAPTGVEAAEIGGVELGENGDATGEGWFDLMKPGLCRLGEARGLDGSPNCRPVPGWVKLGDGRGDGIPFGAWTG